MIIAKGTGINVRNVLRLQMNVSFTLDGDPPSAFTYAWDTQCYTGAPTGCYNISVYNAQSLTYSAHILNITMLSAIGTNLTYSDIWFDYVVVSTPTSSSAIPSSAISSSANPSSTGNTGSSNQRSQ